MWPGYEVNHMLASYPGHVGGEKRLSPPTYVAWARGYHSRLLARWVRNDKPLHLHPYGLVDSPPWSDGRALDYEGSAEQNRPIFLTSNKVVFHCVLECVCVWVCVWVCVCGGWEGGGEEREHMNSISTNCRTISQFFGAW